MSDSALNENTPRVLIVGAGDVGLTLAGVLVGAGLSVTTLNRSGRSVDGASPFVADLDDPVSLTDIPTCDVVVFTTAPPTPDEDGYHLAYVDGPQRVLDALAEEPSRAVLVSTTGVYGADDGRWITSTSPAEPTRTVTRHVIEGENALARRLPTTILRAAGIYGPGRGQFIRRVAAREIAVNAGAADHWTNRIHRDDLAAALAVCVVHPSPPALAIAVDDQPTPRDQVVTWLAGQLGVAVPTGREAQTSPSGKRCRNSELRDLGWAPQYPSFREGYTTLLAHDDPVT